MTQKVRVTVDVHCVDKPGDRASYRLLIGDNLISERDFVWDHEQKYIQEYMMLTLDPGNYSIQVEPVKGQFVAKNLTVDSLPIDDLVIKIQ